MVFVITRVAVETARVVVLEVVVVVAFAARRS